MESNNQPYVVTRRPIAMKPKNVGVISFKAILCILSSCLCIGILFSIMAIPTSLPHEENGKIVKNVLTPSIGGSFFSSSGPSLSSKVDTWVASYLPSKSAIHEKHDTEPDWSQEFWTPIEIDTGGSDPTVTLCKLNFKTYSESPQVYPMNKDLVSLSKCTGSNSKRARLSVLIKEIDDAQVKGLPEGRVLEPTGFVFHESRVGSTLVANALACDPFAMVFSESAPPSNALLKCGRSCDSNRQQHVKLFRDVIRVMGRSPIHKRLFLKFQSITTTQMEIALEAFPNTPWAFIYRQPVQTMMSHVDPSKGGSGAPCLRGMRSPYAEETKYVQMAQQQLQTSSSPKEAWCAARLNMLCNSALRAYSQHGTLSIAANASSGQPPSVLQRGLLVNYEALPGIVPRAMLPMFGVKPSQHWLHKMAEVTSYYSKGRSTKKAVFAGDSEKKDAGSNEVIQTYAKLILSPTFSQLEYALVDGLTRLGVTVPSNVSTVAVGNTAEMIRDWKSMKVVPADPVDPFSVRGMSGAGRSTALLIDAEPATTDQQRSEEVLSAPRYLPDGARYNHSVFEFDTDFKPWIPFSNNHNSRTFEVPECPDKPPKGYPKTYNIKAITNNWLPDNTEIPPFHYDSLCHFDYQNPVENKKAYTYRDAEVPFVLYNIPELDTVVKNWHNLDYLQAKLGKNSKFRTETSDSNHFMYWSGGRKNPRYKDWKPPTGTASYTFEDWLEVAVKGQNVTQDKRKHLYFRASGGGRDDSWVYKELPFFQPKKSLFMVSPRDQRGIHCRFGMRDVVAEAHFDGSRNFIAMIGGLRRWILTHPNQCEFMHMLPKQHPSGRHSEVDWSQPVNDTQFPNFQKVQANEVIMQAGDMLYLPIYWIHYIVQLNVNFQCNTRSGISSHFNGDIRRCGF